MDDILGLEYQEQFPLSVNPASLELAALSRRFDSNFAVEGVSIEIGAGELVALVGASGSGKTTTLRMAAGYETPDSGAVKLDGRDITALPPQKRGFGMVFQHYALFPHLSVQDNVAFGLEARGVSRPERRERAKDALSTVGLASAAGRPVQSLSGGEQQRVALARAVVIEPRVLLLDEPLSNLDPTLRRSMRDELRSMLRKLSVTALLVTHDQEDAFAVADRVALMKGGKLLQIGRPEELYRSPVDANVAGFIGKSTLVPAHVDGQLALVRVGDRTQFAPFLAPPGTHVSSDGWSAVIRPESLELVVGPDDGTLWVGRITSRRFVGMHFVYLVNVEGGLEIETFSRTPVANEDEEILLLLKDEPLALVPT